MVRSESTLKLVEFGVEEGVDPELLLASTGLTLDGLRTTWSEIRFEQELAVTERLLGILGARPGLGIRAAQRRHLTSYSVWGLALLTSRTVREALNLGSRYLELTDSACEIDWRYTDEGLEIGFQATGLPAPVVPFVLERSMGSLQTVLDDLLGRGAIRPRRVAFPFPRPIDTSEYAEWFGTVPQFGAPGAVVILDPRVLETPLPLHNPLMAGEVLDQARAVLARRRERAGFAGLVRDKLLEYLSEGPSQQRIAALLHVSDRTLRLRLASEGTTFRRISDELRAQLAEEYLSDPALTVSEVAARLGFAEVSSFSHAFRRWTGRTPREHRELVARGV